jgi:mannosyl-3-phosphoglycerate phosphatase
MTIIRKLVIFTDLDGTLLDPDTYSFEPATSALDLVRGKGIPLVLSSSKTRAEIELYRRKLGNRHPFISENGGGIFIPWNYFSFRIPCDREVEDYCILELGTFYPRILQVLESVKRESGIAIKGFYELTREELAFLSGLSLEEAAFAKQREYDEAFLVEGGEEEVETVRRKIEEKGLRYDRGGKFHHVLGRNDKGKAVEVLKELYEKEFASVATIGIGDSFNDLPMLHAVDHPVFLRDRKEPSVDIPPEMEGLEIVEGRGPLAWNKAILGLLSRLKSIGEK